MKNEHWCTCKGHVGQDDYTDVTEFFCNNFIPAGWRFGYDRLYGEESYRIIYLTGACRACGGIMQSGTALPTGLTGDTLIAEVYRMMRQYRPFNYKDGAGCYHGSCTERANWYRSQDDLTAQAIEEQFVTLFHQEDQSAAHRWLLRHPDPIQPEKLEYHIGQIVYWRDEPAAPGADHPSEWPESGSRCKITDVCCDPSGYFYAVQARIGGNTCYLRGIGPNCLTATPGLDSVEGVEPVILPLPTPGRQYLLLRSEDTEMGVDFTALAVSQDITLLRQALTNELLDLGMRGVLQGARKSELEEGLGHDDFYFLSWSTENSGRKWATYTIEPVRELTQAEERHG